VDFDFAKDQLLLMLRNLYAHPNGQIPAYEWNFSDVNPPVHAWATLFLYNIEKELGRADFRFLERSFQGLMQNFNWWVNRKDPQGKNVFAGGFLGLDNIGVFDRSSPLPTASATPTPDPFEEGVKQLLQASEKGFFEMRGKFKRTENGSGPDPLFRMRKIYEGTFLFSGAALAEVEEVYYTPGPQPAYNYHLYYQALSTRASIEEYNDFRQSLNRVLKGFEHSFGDRYDAWARNDPHKTAILLSSQEATGSPEIQVHVAFSSAQW